MQPPFPTVDLAAAGLRQPAPEPASDIADPGFEDRAYAAAPETFRAWARQARATIITALSSDLGLPRRPRSPERTIP